MSIARIISAVWCRVRVKASPIWPISSVPEAAKAPVRSPSAARSSESEASWTRPAILPETNQPIPTAIARTSSRAIVNDVVDELTTRSISTPWAVASRATWLRKRAKASLSAVSAAAAAVSSATRSITGASGSRTSSSTPNISPAARANELLIVDVCSSSARASSLSSIEPSSRRLAVASDAEATKVLTISSSGVGNAVPGAVWRTQPA